MSMKNHCCRAILGDFDDPISGSEVICLTCDNHFIWNGATWSNVLELGQRKVDKLRRIGEVNRLYHLQAAGSSNGKMTTDVGIRSVSELRMSARLHDEHGSSAKPKPNSDSSTKPE